MKNSLVSIVLVLSSALCIAQEQEYRVGIEFGPNLLSVIHFDPVIPDGTFASRFGYTVGSEFSFINRQRINVSLRYSDCQYLYHENVTIPGQYFGIHNFSSATISSSMDFFIFKKYIFIRAGAFSNYLLSITNEWFTFGVVDETNYRKRLNYGIVSGVGVCIPLSNRLNGMLLLSNDLWLCSYSRMTSGLPSFYLNETILSVKLLYSFLPLSGKNN